MIIEFLISVRWVGHMYGWSVTKNELNNVLGWSRKVRCTMLGRDDTTAMVIRKDIIKKVWDTTLVGVYSARRRSWEGSSILRFRSVQSRQMLVFYKSISSSLVRDIYICSSAYSSLENTILPYWQWQSRKIAINNPSILRRSLLGCFRSPGPQPGRFTLVQPSFGIHINIIYRPDPSASPLLRDISIVCSILL